MYPDRHAYMLGFEKRTEGLQKTESILGQSGRSFAKSVYLGNLRVHNYNSMSKRPSSFDIFQLSAFRVQDRLLSLFLLGASHGLANLYGPPIFTGRPIYIWSKYLIYTVYNKRYVTYRMLFVNCWINGIKRCYPRCRKRYCQRQDGSLRLEQYELFRISNWISFNWSIVSIFIFCQTNHAFAQFCRAQEELKTFTLTQPLWLIILTVYFQTSKLGSIGKLNSEKLIFVKIFCSSNNS